MADKTSAIEWDDWVGRHRIGLVTLATGDTFDLIADTGKDCALWFIGADGDLSAKHRHVTSPNTTSAWSGASPNLFIDGPSYNTIPLIPFGKKIPLRFTNEEVSATNVVVFSIEKLN